MSEMKQDPTHFMLDYISNKKPFQTVSNPENASVQCDNSSVDSPNMAPNTDIVDDVSNVSGEYRIIDRVRLIVFHSLIVNSSRIFSPP